MIERPEQTDEEKSLTPLEWENLPEWDINIPEFKIKVPEWENLPEWSLEELPEWENLPEWESHQNEWLETK